MHMPAPLFSIATPVRNELAGLKRCIGSVRGQTGVSFEHLVQDAASTDGGARWLAAQAALRDNLLPVSEGDGGMYDAINRAWGRARGRYLSWLNADEQVLPGTLAFVHQWFEAHPEVDVHFGDYLVVRADGSPVALRREIPFRRAYVVNGFLPTASCTLYFRRELWDRGLLRLDDRLRYAADKDLMLRLHKAGARIGHSGRVLALFGIDGGNLSGHPGMLQEAEAVRRAHGAMPAPLRPLVMLGRRAERLLRGGYRPRDVSFSYAVDEVPHYREICAPALGGRYSLADGLATVPGR